MDYQIKTLHNGIKVVLLHYPHLESVTVSATVRTGSRHESETESGISHFLEHMAFKGTTKRTADQINFDMDYIGANMNAYTSEDVTKYYVSGHNKDTATFIDFITDITFNSVFPEDEFESERQVILEEYNQRQDDPGTVVWEAFAECAYAGQSAGRRIIGTPETIKSFMREDLVRYMERQYTGENVIIGITGNLTGKEDELLAMIEERVTHVSRGTANAIPQTTFNPGVTYSEKDLVSCKVGILFPAASKVDDDSYRETIASAALGNGFSSPLFQIIREKLALAYQIGTSVNRSPVDGTMSIWTNIQYTNIEKYLGALRDIMNNISDHITEDDVERAKNGVLVSLATSTENPAALMGKIANNLFLYGEVLDDAEREAKVRAITRNDVLVAFGCLFARLPVVTIGGVETKIDKEVVQKFYESFYCVTEPV